MLRETVSLRFRDLLKSAPRRVSLLPHEVMYREGESAPTILFLESGLIKLTRKLASNRDALVRFAFPGEFFGERSLLAVDGHRAFTAQASDYSEVSEFPRDAFLSQCQHDKELWAWYLEMSAKRLEDTERRLHQISFLRVENRILHALSDLATALSNSGGPRSEITIPVSQGELADLVGATRETTSAVLNSLARRGLLQLGRRLVTVPSSKVLKAAADK